MAHLTQICVSRLSFLIIVIGFLCLNAQEVSFIIKLIILEFIVVEND